MFIILSFITCGIYSIYFWYKYAKDVNIICSGDGDQTTDYITALLLGIVTCGIYTFYWYYKLGNRLQNNGPRYNVRIDESGTTILMWIIIGSIIAGVGSLIGMYFVIKNFNALAESYNNYQRTPQQPV